MSGDLHYKVAININDEFNLAAGRQRTRNAVSSDSKGPHFSVPVRPFVLALQEWNMQHIPCLPPGYVVGGECSGATLARNGSALGDEEFSRIIAEAQSNRPR